MDEQQREAAFDRHTQEGFHCTDPSCMFPLQPYTWCTR